METSLKKFGFSAKERLKRKGDIQAVFKKGKKISCSGAKLFFLPNGLDENRVMFTFPRKYGNAVRRNTSRRRGREVYRQNSFRLKKGFDLVFLFFPEKDGFRDRLFQFESLCERAGLLAL